jgi:ketosteroid isomerase-like protein
MSRENFVRTRLRPHRSSASRRAIDERLLLRLPAVSDLIASALERLPPRSRLRRGLLGVVVRRGYGASSRGDYDVALLAYDPNVEIRFNEVGGIVPPDLLGLHRGHDGFRRLWEDWRDAWEEIRLEPQEILDFGSGLLVVVRIVGRGKGSGIPIDEDYFEVFALRGGKVIRQENFLDRDSALKAVGVSE